MQSILTISYLIGSISFIVGLKMLSHPMSAKAGNLVAAAGMSIAIFATIFLYRNNGESLHNYVWIFSALILGTVMGTLIAKRVQMTAMPEMVSLFNGMGGACAMLISVMEFRHICATSSYNNGYYLLTESTGHLHIFIIIVAMVIGAVSFSGSLVAYGKLNGSVKDFSFKGQQYINLILFGVILVYIVVFSLNTPESLNEGLIFYNYHLYLFYGLIFLSLFYGVMFVLPIGGADMPVVISLLNSFTGMAAAFGGFLYGNQVMLTGGILVGAAGTLLTILMCRAMNRSLKNVLLGAFGASSGVSDNSQAEGGYKEISIMDVAALVGYSSKVMIVPGYGLAVAQAQHICHELEELLIEKGVEVSYAIHPVAGRMPGHMNVLLAEAGVEYDKLQEMDDANEQLKRTDVVLILGANDVVNPAAKSDPASPIYGMPILEVEQAKVVIVNKRSMKPGYAGIENMLFYQPKTSMLFGDAKSVLQNLVSEIKGM